MARTRTGTQLIADVRALADVEGATTRHPDADILRHINQAICAFRELVSSWGSDWYLARAAITITAGARTATIAGTPAIDRVLSVSVTESTTGGLRRLERVDIDAEDEVVSTVTGEVYGYRWEAQTLRLYPLPSASGTGEMVYIAAHTDIAAGGTFDGVNGGEDWVVYEAALRVAERDDDDARAARLANRLAMMEDRIRRIAKPSGVVCRQNTRARRLSRFSRWGDA